LRCFEKERVNVLAKELEHIWALEEIKARQRSRDKNILAGERNTPYFHAVANNMLWKNRIAGLNGPKGLVQETNKILKIAVDFYKKLFKEESRGHFALDENFWDPEDLITSEEGEELEAPFSEFEIRETIFSCYPEVPQACNTLFSQRNKTLEINYLNK
jgi:hypothetical protein